MTVAVHEPATEATPPNVPFEPNVNPVGNVPEVTAKVMVAVTADGTPPTLNVRDALDVNTGGAFAPAIVNVRCAVAVRPHES